MKEDTLQQFEKITSFDIFGFIDDYLNFHNFKRDKIIDFYSGIGEYDSESFDLMNELKSRVAEAILLFDKNKNTFNYISFWDLLSVLEDINVQLDTLSNIFIFLKSNISKGETAIGIEKDITITKNKTLEKITKDELNNNSFEDEWSSLALKNDLNEEKYTPEGGVILKATFDRNSVPILESIVGSMEGENIKGKDIQKKIEFNDNDLTVLSPNDTIKQAIEILLNLNKGDIPEFRTEGKQSSLIIGNNIGSVTFPAIFRQISNSFSKDDTFDSISLTDINQKDDGIFVEFEIRSKYGEIYKEEISFF